MVSSIPMEEFILFGILILLLIVLITAIASILVRVPFVPTPMRIARKMIDFADLKGNETVYDLGCGDGRILIAAKKKYPSIRAIGYELPVGVYLLAKMHVWLSRQKVEIHMRDFWSLDLSNADVIFLYLTPEVCARFEEKFNKELKPGTKVVSHGFALKWKEPEKVERVPVLSWKILSRKFEGPRVYLYRW